jgi:hypothetical protein
MIGTFIAYLPMLFQLHGLGSLFNLMGSKHKCSDCFDMYEGTLLAFPDRLTKPFSTPVRFSFPRLEWLLGMSAGGGQPGTCPCGRSVSE